MQNQYDPRTTDGIHPAVSVGVPRAARDAGLRSYMLSVYNYMASGVLLTGIVALIFANTEFGIQIMTSPLRWLVILSPLAIVFAMSFGVNRMKTSTIQTLFWAFAVLMGMSMSTIFAVYTGVSIAQTFFAVTAAFMGLSLWGYTTKKDLSGWGTFLIMGVVGLLVAMVDVRLCRGHRHAGQVGGDGRADALPGLHQHVQLPAELHGQSRIRVRPMGM